MLFASLSLYVCLEKQFSYPQIAGPKLIGFARQSCLESSHYRAIGQQDTTVAVAPMDDTIVFNAVGAGGRDLYLLDVRSRIVSRIAETPDYETSDSFSPDGRRIVYSAGVPGDRADHIFTMDRNGNSKEQLTDIDANDTSGKYSPDGEQIVFARDKTYNWGGMAANWGTGGVICIIDADGSNFRQLTIDEEFAFDPYFSADGRHVIYSTASERRSIPVDRDTGPQQIAGPLGAVPSYDGRLIAYSRGKYSPDLQVFIANADATSERLVSSQLHGCSTPVFTHACDALYFFQEQWPDGYSGVPKLNLWKASIDGTNVDFIAGPGLFDAPLNWKPKQTH